ncbi:APC family permease [Cupriavidus taiwanensis]|uniref:Putative amino acid permease n=1 Tax=Cupriavidus taiwanensis TaxID=164546 RepID=A0A7Z7NMJ0_9BURK|nr:APC family permease [Cupriavidus taiwanensis]SOZ08581.1 putative amino acid permease [Cupriavidus taiwanensis]SOZ10917.1 putative amino acid permease [Cupriavidus taiwanensis]SOZ42228.1 putative amino acid permease [Cupriavidus taiwanensis]SPC21280.1 putative amino acid permease [Cupriavidus taiwanensis]SPD55422.1 putative amino acid permease [Cupriavidus taiwanensis]
MYSQKDVLSLGAQAPLAPAQQPQQQTQQPTASHELQRSLTWKDAFWVTSGVPAGVLFTIGGVSATIGNPAWVIWILAILVGFAQCFVYAEISGLYPHKSGGASVYGAMGWVRYSKFVAPVSVWCNWVAWSPMLALGTSLAAGYMLSALFPADSVINTWQLTLVDLGFVSKGLTLRVNSTFLLATAFLLITFKLQHSGASAAATTQRILGIASLTPLVVIALVPLFTGDMPSTSFFPLLPLTHDAAGAAVLGGWNAAGISTAMGAMFLACWSTFGFETAVCYTREFKDPQKDTFKAIFWSGVLCLFMFIAVPIAFQGSLGLQGMLAPDIIDGSGVGAAMARFVGGGAVVFNVIVVMLVLAILLIVMTSMMGSSRTLYQASVDGWLPRYLSHVNEHGSPTRAMWTDLLFNLFLLLMSNYMAVLSISNVCYMIFVFLNLQSGWIHRMDRPDWPRPYKCKNWLLALGAFLGFFDLAFVGAGANFQGEHTLRNGLIAALLIVPVFIYRHYIQDKGRFPESMRRDMELPNARAGVLPYVALVVGALVVWIAARLTVIT